MGESKDEFLKARRSKRTVNVWVRVQRSWWQWSWNREWATVVQSHTQDSLRWACRGRNGSKAVFRSSVLGDTPHVCPASQSLRFKPPLALLSSQHCFVLVPWTASYDTSPCDGQVCLASLFACLSMKEGERGPDTSVLIIFLCCPLWQLKWFKLLKIKN